MLQTDNSIRGKVMRELIARVASDNLIGRKFKSGELRKKMTEPEWRVPEFYNLRVIEEKNCRLELLECEIKNERLVLLQLHGGGYIGGMRNAYRSFAGLYSELGRGMSVLTVDYRVAPEHPYPAALEDAITGYNWLLQAGWQEHEIVVAGRFRRRRTGTGTLHVSEESEPETSGGADLYVALDRSDPVRCIV